jgi:hypothetical protein
MGSSASRRAAAPGFLPGQGRVPEHETFYVICEYDRQRQCRTITVLREVPANTWKLSSFSDPVLAIDFAQEQVRRLNARGAPAEYVDPPDDLIGTG